MKEKSFCVEARLGLMNCKTIKGEKIFAHMTLSDGKGCKFSMISQFLQIALQVLVTQEPEKST